MLNAVITFDALAVFVSKTVRAYPSSDAPASYITFLRAHHYACEAFTLRNEEMVTRILGLGERRDQVYFFIQS